MPWWDCTFGFGILGGYILFANKSQSKSLDKDNQKTTQISPAISTPTKTVFPTSEPTGILKSYVSSSLGLSFQYTTPYGISENIKDYTELKADDEIWVALPGSDKIILRIFYYKSNLSVSNWWETEGYKKIQSLQDDYNSAIQPKPSPALPPKFITKNGTLDGKPSLVAEGVINAPLTPGIQTITLVNYKNGVYMFIQQEDDKKLSDKILATLKFIE